MMYILCTQDQSVCNFLRRERVFGNTSRRSSGYGELYESSTAKIFYLPFKNSTQCAAEIGHIAASHEMQSAIFIAASVLPSLSICNKISNGAGASYIPDILYYHDREEVEVEDLFLFTGASAMSLFLPPHHIFCFLLGIPPERESAEIIAHIAYQRSTEPSMQRLDVWLHQLTLSESLRHVLKRKIFAYYARHHRLALDYWQRIVEEHHSHLPLFKLLDT